MAADCWSEQCPAYSCQTMMVRFVDCGLGNLTVRHMSRFLSRLGATTWSSGANTSAGVSMPMGLMQWRWRFLSLLPFSPKIRTQLPTPLLVYCWCTAGQTSFRQLPAWFWCGSWSDHAQIVGYTHMVVRWLSRRFSRVWRGSQNFVRQDCQMDGGQSP